MTITATQLARELWTVACFDEDATIPATVLLRIAQRESLDLEVCQTCGQFDAEHLDDCEHGNCSTCGQWYRACNCDSNYERAAGK